jgi:hypothetical protein
MYGFGALDMLDVHLVAIGGPQVSLFSRCS